MQKICLKPVPEWYNGFWKGRARVTRGKRRYRDMLSPFRGRRGFYDPVSEMNRMFDDMLGNLARRPRGQQSTEVTEWAPAIDVVTEDGNLVIRAELPGVNQEDVDITLHNNVLTISGERKAEQEEERGGYYVRERRYGSFSRSLA